MVDSSLAAKARRHQVEKEDEAAAATEWDRTQDPSSAPFDDNNAALPTSLSLGTIVQIDGLVSAQHYNGRRGVVVSGLICNDERVAVQLLDQHSNVCGKTLQARPANLVDCSSSSTDWKRLLKDRASLIWESKDNSAIWVGDCLAASLAHGESCTRLFDSTEQLDEAIRLHPWLRTNFSVCCAAEMGGRLKLKDRLDERPEERWTKVLDDVYSRIKAGRTRVLIYCVEGRSRSVTIALALLVRLGTALDNAWHAVKTARPVAKPNVAFTIILLRLYFDDSANLSELALNMGLTAKKVQQFTDRYVKFAEDKLRTFIEASLLPSLLTGETLRSG